MEENEENKNADTEEDEVLVDPKLLKPDLYNAAQANDTQSVLAFLLQGVPPTFIDTKNGWTALHWAAINGNAKMMAKLLSHGASEPYHRLVEKERKVRLAASNSGVGPKSRKKKNHDNEEATGEEKFETINEREGEDNEDDDNDSMDIEKQLEVSVDLLKNTPLLWATHKGNLRCVWLLLNDNYSPNDLDNMGNTALHLAATTGDLKILKVLIDDGASANIVNHYKNLPIDMAKSKEAREVLAHAMEAGASMTEKDMQLKHENNMKQYAKIDGNLRSAVSEASRINSPRTLKTMTAGGNSKLSRILSDAITVGKEFSLDEDLIKEGDILLLKLEASQELLADVYALQQVVPIRTQEAFLEHVSKLERSIEKAEAAGIDRSQLQGGLDLIARCQIEYWLAVLLTRLKDVVTANDSNEHDMNKLSAAIKKAESRLADQNLIDEGRNFFGRLTAELGMSRAIKTLPTVKPYLESPPEGYYTERDTGSIRQTEEYPSPPEGGEYIWIPAETFTALQQAIEKIKLSYNGAEALGANAAIIAETKEKLAKAEKDLKMLTNKEEFDKNAAIEVAKKAAKKLKKGKGKKK